MRVIHRNILSKDGSGTFKLLPETPEDMWHCYNLIAVGDHLQTTTTRKVVSETATGSRSSSKVRMVLKVEVEKIEFDEVSCVMRIGGKNKKKVRRNDETQQTNSSLSDPQGAHEERIDVKRPSSLRFSWVTTTFITPSWASAHTFIFIAVRKRCAE